MNGWTNWSTWNVALWLDNDEPLYRQKRAFFARRTPDADNVEAFVREAFPTGTPDMDGKNDLDDVNWDELAESFKE